MASACINNIGLSPDNFLDCSPTYSSYSWLTPRASLAREMPDDASNSNRIPSPVKLSDLPEEPDLDLSDIADFEFRLEDPVMMLPADQLFSEGKLIPLHLPLIHPDATSSTTAPSDVSSPDTPKPRRRISGVSVADPFLYSPKAPRCSSRWKELLGLRKLYQSNNAKQDINSASSSSSRNGNGNVATKSIKHLLHRSSKSSNDLSVNLPLLKDTDNEPTSVSSRLSLSSSSSGHDPDDLPRLSLDSEKPGKVNQNTNTNNPPPRMRMVKTRTMSSDGSGGTTRGGRSPMRCPADTHARGVSIDSPRMNSSGKIVFHSLERSSSSPSSFNGGPRFKLRGMERSYSANVRVSPVLNVPVCSLRGSSMSGGVFGLPLFSSTQKREGTNGGGAGRQQINGKSKTDRSGF